MGREQRKNDGENVFLYILLWESSQLKPLTYTPLFNDKTKGTSPWPPSQGGLLRILLARVK